MTLTSKRTCALFNGISLSASGVSDDNWNWKQDGYGVVKYTWPNGTFKTKVKACVSNTWHKTIDGDGIFPGLMMGAKRYKFRNNEVSVKMCALAMICMLLAIICAHKMYKFVKDPYQHLPPFPSMHITAIHTKVSSYILLFLVLKQSSMVWSVQEKNWQMKVHYLASKPFPLFNAQALQTLSCHRCEHGCQV